MLLKVGFSYRKNLKIDLFLTKNSNDIQTGLMNSYKLRLYFTLKQFPLIICIFFLDIILLIFFFVFIENVLPFYCVLFFNDIFIIYFNVFKLMYHFTFLPLLLLLSGLPSLAWPSHTVPRDLKATETWGKQSRRKKVGIFPRFFFFFKLKCHLNTSFPFARKCAIRIVDCFRLD